MLAAEGANEKYEKTIFSGEVAGRQIERTVYQNSDVDPNAVIPAGTLYSNGRPVSESISNIELMEQGKAPFVETVNENGERVLVQVELHHLTGREKLNETSMWDSENNSGSLVEIASDAHDKFSGTLHIPKEKGESFRNDGELSKQFDKFRKEYWKRRAAECKKGNNS